MTGKKNVFMPFSRSKASAAAAAAEPDATDKKAAFVPVPPHAACVHAGPALMTPRQRDATASSVPLCVPSCVRPCAKSSFVSSPSPVLSGAPATGSSNLSSPSPPPGGGGGGGNNGGANLDVAVSSHVRSKAVPIASSSSSPASPPASGGGGSGDGGGDIGVSLERAAADAAVATVYDVILPGTHDSAAYTARPELQSRTTSTPLRWSVLRNLTSRVASEFAVTQSLSIIQQLRAGARFLDVRVTKRPASSGDTAFWTHHGMVLCLPLADFLDQVNTFHAENEAKGARTTPIILVFRETALTPAESGELANFVPARLQNPVFKGSASDLRNIPLARLPHNVVAGLRDAPLDLAWGRDPWLDTYEASEKIAFLSKLLDATARRDLRDSLLVLGWTITPAVSDIVLRVVTLGVLRSTLLAEATRFNTRFPAFRAENADALKSTANVIFFDDFSQSLADQVNSLNS